MKRILLVFSVCMLWLLNGIFAQNQTDNGNEVQAVVGNLSETTLQNATATQQIQNSRNLKDLLSQKNNNLQSFDQQQNLYKQQIKQSIADFNNVFSKNRLLRKAVLNHETGIGPTELLVYILIGLLILVVLKILGIDLIFLLTVALLVILIILLLRFL